MYKKPEPANPETFNPEISKKSKKLADKQRGKMQGENNGKKTATAVVKHLLMKEQVRAEQKQKKAEAIIKEKEDEQEFTFKPKTNKYPGKGGATSGDKCLDLYSRVKRGQISSKVGKTSLEVEYEREQEECTHQPKINKPGSHMKKASKSTSEIRGFDEQKNRMAQGRVQKEVKEQAVDRNPTVQPSGVFARKASKQSAEPPKLYGNSYVG